jgi:hypothetical protein
MMLQYVDCKRRSDTCKSDDGAARFAKPAAHLAAARRPDDQLRELHIEICSVASVVSTSRKMLTKIRTYAQQSGELFSPDRSTFLLATG